MEIDVRGRVDNTPLKPYRALWPLFEAISNSRQSIGASTNKTTGLITIRLERAGAGLFGDATSPIRSIAIEDNGAGFTEANYRAFHESDSRHKHAVGGKGMGRFFGLKAFEYVAVDSNYSEDGTWRRRRFLFTYSREGIENMVCEPSTEAAAITIVRLINPYPKFAEHIPKTAQTIAARIAEHFLPILFDPLSPRIIILDGDDVLVDVNEVFRETFAGHSTVEDFDVGSESFTIRHIFNYGTAETPGHFVHFFAQDRGVLKEILTKFLPGFYRSTRIIDGDRSFYYLGLVAGNVLDQSVDFDRHSFDLPSYEAALGAVPGAITMTSIERGVANNIRRYLEPYIAPVQEAKLDRVRRLAVNQPQNHYLLKYHREAIERIPPDITDDAALDAELRKIEFTARAELNTKLEDIKRKSVRSVEDIAEFKEEYLKFMEEHRELGQAKLAEYVSVRRVVLDLFERFLAQDSDGDFALEEVLHAIICPRRVTSADALFASHNLWLVDERLEYHAFLASDMELSRIEELDSGETKRPDVLLFNHQLTFTDQYPYSSAVILEFKRPQRNDYTRASNPVAQIEESVDRLKQGRVKDDRGRFIQIPNDMPCYGYAICDRTPTLSAVARVSSWDSTPDGRGYYGYNKTLRLYWELMEYEKMLDNARKRNRVLFDKLGLPTR